MFTQADYERIAQAVRSAEAKTSGELLVVIVPQSDAYDLSRLGAALALGFAAGLGAVFWPALVWHCEPLAVHAVVTLGLWLVFGAPSLLRRLIPGGVVSAAVHDRALQAFAEQGVHNTRERTGILLFMSLLERRVEILADTGIDARVGEDGWRAYVQRIVDAIHAGRAADEICAVIADLGDVLARDFPRRAEDVNELPDAPVRAS